MLEEYIKDPLVIKVGLTILVVLGTIILNFLGSFIINKKVIDIRQRHGSRTLVHYAFSLAMLVMLFFIWFQHPSSWGTLIAIGGAGLIIALQDLILSFFGWVVIIQQGLFSPGNRIEVNEIKGDVLDVSFLHTTLVEIDQWVHADQSTGRIIKFPNNLVLKHPVKNYNKGFPFVWNEIKIIITFESDILKAKEIILAYGEEYNTYIKEMESSIKKMSSQYLIYYKKLTPIVYTEVKDNGVELSLRHLTPIKKRRSITCEIYEKILIAFKQEKEIDFAYPTVRYYSK
jgi:small-conductance mechanosensitive channel